MSNQIVKSQVYDHTISTERYQLSLARSAAGASGTFGQYYARGNETVWSAGAFQVTAGTSTYTTTSTTIANGTYTTAVNTNTAATLVQAYRVSGTTTTTSQTFVIAAANSTNGAVALNNFSAMNVTGTLGGINLLAGDQLYMLGGTDATAVVGPVWEMSYTPLSTITA